MSWYEDDPLVPSRAELDREAYEDWLAETYEARYQEFCREQMLDPQDPASASIYEEAWLDEQERSN